MNNYTLKEALQEVRTIVDRDSKRIATLEPNGLFQPISYTLDLGGKRLRPLLALICYRLFKPEGDLEEIAPVLRAVELFHNFSLIHDDLMDDAPIRRGAPTVYKKWGQNSAVLSGDAMLIEAYRSLEKLAPEKLVLVFPVFNKMAMGVCAGQQLDIEYEKVALSDLSLDQYLKMIDLKTGMLFAYSAMMGALVGGVQSDNELILLSNKMKGFGFAFQIMDDYLDLFSEEEIFGKRAGGDILEGKRTYLLLSAYKQRPEEVMRILALEDDECKISAMRDLYVKLGVDRAALELVNQYLDFTEEEMKKFSADVTLLRELFLSLKNRNQ